MRPSDFNRILEYRFNNIGDKYWCFSFDEEKGLLFMYVSDNYAGLKKMRKRMRTVAGYLLGQFEQVKAVIFPETTYTKIEDTIVIKNQTVMIEKKETGNWLPVVKKVVDDVYDLLIKNPEGAIIVATSYGKRGSRVCTELVGRGIIEKKRVALGKCVYRWVANMGPTKVLYGSIAQKLYDEDQKYRKTYNNKNKAAKAMEKESAQEAEADKPAPVSTVEAPVQETPVVNEPVAHVDPVVETSTVPSIDELKSAWVELIKKFEDRPRLTNALMNARLFIMDKTESVLVFFSVVNEALQQWILKNIIFELQGALREITHHDKLFLCPAVEIEPVNAKEPEKHVTADDFSAQENWDALKKKGATIEENHLVMTEVKVIKTVLS